MVELLNPFSSAEQKATAPYAPKGIVYSQRLFRFLTTQASTHGVHPDIATGVTEFFFRSFSDDCFPVVQPLALMQGLAEITEGLNYSKSRSLRYLTGDVGVDQTVSQVLANARWMVDNFGLDFFSRSTNSSQQRKSFFKASIPDSQFYLSAKGGSGSGTFSVDFALGVEKRHGYTVSGEIWRSGFDTEVLANGALGIRLIRTGTAVRHDASKTEKFDEFKHDFKTSPARVLTFILIGVSRSFAAEQIIALTTVGAQRLSTLPRKDRAYNYTNHYQEMGFTIQDNGLWLRLTREQHPRKKEIEGMTRISQAFVNLIDQDGNRFPVRSIS